MSYLSQKKASLWLAGFVLATFLTSIVCPPGVWAQPKAAAEANRTADLPEISPELGTLQTSGELPRTARLFEAGPAKPFVLHIQDAHANPDAQRKIHDILETAVAQYAAKGRPVFVALEGARGPLHPEFLDFSREYPEINRAIAQDLL